jgi:hypothetical protein
MQVAERYGSNRANPRGLKFDGLVGLAAPSTPDDVRAAVEQRIAAGELVTAAEENRLRDAAKGLIAG